MIYTVLVSMETAKQRSQSANKLK